MFTFFFSPDPVTDWESAKKCDTARFGQFFHFMLERGVYLAPSQFEAAFVSTAHSEEDIRYTVEAAREFFGGLVEIQLDRRSRAAAELTRGRGLVRGDFEIPRTAHDHGQVAHFGFRVGQRQAVNAFGARAHFKRTRLDPDETRDCEIRDQVAEAIHLEDGAAPSVLAFGRRLGHPDAHIVMDQFAERRGLRALRQMRGGGSEYIAAVKRAADFAAHEFRDSRSREPCARRRRTPSRARRYRAR